MRLTALTALEREDQFGGSPRSNNREPTYDKGRRYR